MQIRKVKFSEAIAPDDEAKKEVDALNLKLKRKYPPKTIFFEPENDGTYIAKIKDANGNKAQLRYSKLLGLQFL